MGGASHEVDVASGTIGGVAHPLPVHFFEVQAWVPILALGQQQGGGEKQVLFDVSGAAEPGEILALMGPSGSGKTSLLSLLGGRSTARSAGSITFGGQRLTKLLKRRVGFVSQDDLLFPMLTVFETLHYAALLRLPRELTKVEKAARVEAVLGALGLGRCRSTIIGDHSQRGVSGGERKRVAIGHELLINPSAVLLDEPTSGLDSATALMLLNTLRELAGGGRTIITSIHQPSSRLYQQMDKLLLLSEGHVMFYGAASAAAAWFGSLNVPCPFGVSVADHILDLANSSELDDDGGSLSSSLAQAYESRAAGLGKGGIRDGMVATSVEPHVDRDTPRKNKAQDQDQDLQLHEPGSGSAEHQAGDVEAASDGAQRKWEASWVQQVLILASRSLKTRRQASGSLNFLTLGEQMLVAALTGMFWWQMGRSSMDAQTVTDISGLLFFVLLITSVHAMYHAVFVFPSEFGMIVKERQSGMYRLSAYYAARSLTDIPMSLTVPTLFTWAVYWMAGLRLSAGAFFANWWTVLIVTLVGQAHGLVISATFNRLDNALSIAIVVMLVALLVPGYYTQSMPTWIGWTKYLSYLFYGYSLVLKVEFRGRSYPCDLIVEGPDVNGTETNGSCTVADTEILPVDVDAPVTRDALVLLLFLFALRFITYWALRHRTAFRKT